MNLWSLLYRQSLDCGGGVIARIKTLAFRRLRKLVLRAKDPACLMKIHGVNTWMPLSHEAPTYQRAAPLYDSLLGRLACYLREKHGCLVAIDVGANIGDTILACHPRVKDQFLAIEPNPHFYGYLRRNIQHQGINAVLSPTLCCAQDEQSNYQVIEGRGTARMVRADAGTSIPSETLASIANRHLAFGECHLIKIDTDGHDFEVLRGAYPLIERSKPIVLIEADLFGSSGYDQEVVESIDRLRSYGYDTLLIYDNLGHLYCISNLTDLDKVHNALFYQITSQRLYYDFLFLCAGAEFATREIEFFSDTCSSHLQQQMAKRLGRILSRKHFTG